MATKTKSSTKSRKTAPKRVTKRKQTQSDDALNALAKKVRKDPQAATKAERKKVVDAGLVMRGLKGKQRQHFIDTGEDSRTAVKNSPKPKAAKKTRSGAMPIHDALHAALAKGAMEQAALVEKVEALRGRPTAAGTVRPYLKSEAYRQQKDGKWTLA